MAYCYLHIFDPLSVGNWFGYAIVTFIGYFFYKFSIYPLYLSPLSKIPGPPTKHFLKGNVKVFHDADIGENLIRWEKQYGSFFRVHGFLN
ncbi:3318_t:CDS:2, partial [Cetraspora pellucida]